MQNTLDNKPFNIKETPKYYAMTGRNEAWIANPQNKLPVSCTCFVVEDTMEGPNGIEASWIFASYGLRNAQGVAISLRNIRAAGTVNDKGLVASGPCSFAKFYSLINQELRRGGTYKNGAVNLHLDYNHPDVVNFMLMDRSELPWAFKTIDVDDNFISYLADQEINRTVTTSYIDPITNKVVYVKRFYKTALDVLIANIQSGDLFLSKIVYDKYGNRLDSNVCLEVYFKSRATCLIGHTNYGIVKPSEIPTAMVDNMHYLCNLHAYTNVGNDGKYLSSDEDRQVLLGGLGFANLLALEDVTYLDFVIALENITGISISTRYSDKAFEIASYINHGYIEAGKVARSYNMERYFGIAPTATCSYKYKDKYGYTTTPEIAPPISQTVERDSSTFGAVMYEYPPNVEIADHVGFDTFFRLNNAWQRMMELAGEESGAHSISTNWWSDKIEMNREFLQKWSDSYHRSLYYSLAVSSDTLNKADILTLDNVDVNCPLTNKSVNVANNKEVCIPCGE